MLSYFVFEIKGQNHVRHQLNSMRLLLLRDIGGHVMPSNLIHQLFQSLWSSSGIKHTRSLCFHVSLCLLLPPRWKAQALHLRASVTTNCTLKGTGMWFPKIGSFLTFSKPLPSHESFPDACASPVWEGGRGGGSAARRSWWVHAYTWDHGGKVLNPD